MSSNPENYDYIPATPNPHGYNDPATNNSTSNPPSNYQNYDMSNNPPPPNQNYNYPPPPNNVNQPPPVPITSNPSHLNQPRLTMNNNNNIQFKPYNPNQNHHSPSNSYSTMPVSLQGGNNNNNNNNSGPSLNGNPNQNLPSSNSNTISMSSQYHPPKSSLLLEDNLNNLIKDMSNDQIVLKKDGTHDLIINLVNNIGDEAILGILNLMSHRLSSTGMNPSTNTPNQKIELKDVELYFKQNFDGLKLTGDFSQSSAGDQSNNKSNNNNNTQRNSLDNLNGLANGSSSSMTELHRQRLDLLKNSQRP